jgi:hypothetical protein
MTKMLILAMVPKKCGANNAAERCSGKKKGEGGRQKFQQMDQLRQKRLVNV